MGLLNLKNHLYALPMGCKLEYGIYENTLIKSRSIDASKICGIGRYGFQFINHPDRLKEGLCRSKAGGSLENISIEEALNLSITKIDKTIKEYGPDSVAILLGSRLSNESLYSIKRFAESAGINKLISDIDFYDRQYFNITRNFRHLYAKRKDRRY